MTKHSYLVLILTTLLFKNINSLKVYGDPDVDLSTPYDDFHYPEEETEERKSANVPNLIEIHNDTATISIRNETVTVKEGDVAFEVWDVRAVSSDFVVLHRNFDRWGLVSFLSLSSSSWSERKSVGKLTRIDQPYFNISNRYLDRVREDPTDYPWNLATSRSKSSNNVTFSDIARTLTPQRDLVAISNKNAVVKFVVSHVGRIKCGARKNTNMLTEGGIVELRNASAPLANNQTVIFDPKDFLSNWPDRFENTKTGLLGGYFNVANIGSYSNSTGHGFELLAFVSASSHFDEIEYSPSVLVSLKEDEDGETTSRYFRVSNCTNQKISASEFYRELDSARSRVLNEFQGAMDISLPGVDGARQRDMTRFAIFSSLSNFIFNQSNYGFGGTYWSVAREDNGSLPLNVLSVDEAMLNFGMCGMSVNHLDYYVRNYIDIDDEGSGSFQNYTWGSAGDSLSDYGRLISILIRALELCRPDSSTRQRFINTSLALSRNLVNRIASNVNESKSCTCDGLLTGAPEHDWSSVRNKCFWNNNVWTFRGLQDLSHYISDTNLINVTSIFHSRLVNALERCTQQDGFIPPYANVTYEPFVNMTESYEASYSNFRFYPETLLSGFLEENTLNNLLDLHNAKGGRVGGASRTLFSFSRKSHTRKSHTRMYLTGWQDHLDDMPVAGWGYGALLANRTSDFHALLYGHMSTYQSRGSFHTTEQLSFYGSGLYRDFLHFADPPVIPNDIAPSGSSHHDLSAGYYSPEQDISFCIVTQILTARLTRWQLVFEEFSKKNIWFAKAAPDRWYEKGFGVFGAPTFCGNVSYTYYDANLTYSFQIERVSSRCMQGNVWFNFRWNHNVSSVRLITAGDGGNIETRLVQVDTKNRISSVVLLGGGDDDDDDDDDVTVKFSLKSF